jgi:hypothetical protein
MALSPSEYPDTKLGLVIRFSFLWSSEHDQGAALDPLRRAELLYVARLRSPAAAGRSSCGAALADELWEVANRFAASSGEARAEIIPEGDAVLVAGLLCIVGKLPYILWHIAGDES